MSELPQGIISAVLTGVDAVVNEAERLGLKTQYRFGTVLSGSVASAPSRTLVTLDNDTAPSRCFNYAGPLVAGDRVLTMEILPHGVYIIGSANATGPRGLMAAPVEATANGTATSGTTDTRDAQLADYVFMASPNRRYEVVINNLIGNGSIANDIYAIRVRNGGDVTPTTASPFVGEYTWHVIATGTTGRNTIPFCRSFPSPGAGLVTLAMFVQRLTGTGVFTPLAPAGDNGSDARELYVKDIGPA